MIDDLMPMLHKALVLQPGDIVVVEFDRAITREQAQEVRALFAEKQLQAIVLGKGVRIARETVAADGD